MKRFAVALALAAVIAAPAAAQDPKAVKPKDFPTQPIEYVVVYPAGSGKLDEVRERTPGPELDAVYAALEDTAAALRSTVTELHPQVLAQLGLTPAVRELLRQFESRYGVDVRADLEEVGKPDSQQLLYRAARELLTNIGKHAQASSVSVRLGRIDDRVVLTVSGDGVGVESLKPSDDGRAVIVRLYNTGDRATQAVVSWSAPEPTAVHRSALDEKAREPVGRRIDLPPRGLVSLRAEW